MVKGGLPALVERLRQRVQQREGELAALKVRQRAFTSVFFAFPPPVQRA